MSDVKAFVASLLTPPLPFMGERSEMTADEVGGCFEYARAFAVQAIEQWEATKSVPQK